MDWCAKLWPRPHPLRQLAWLLHGRRRLPRAAHHGRRRTLAGRSRSASPRRGPTVLLVGRRVRSARTIRHTRAVGIDVRPRLARPQSHLAAIQSWCARRWRAHARRSAPDPRPVRRQVVDDRSLARPGDGSTRCHQGLGRHCSCHLHRSRPLPRRARCARPRRVGQASVARVPNAWAHPDDGVVAWRRNAGRHVRCAHHYLRSACHAARCFWCQRLASNPRPFAGAAAHRPSHRRARLVAHRSVGP